MYLFLGAVVTPNTFWYIVIAFVINSFPPLLGPNPPPPIIAHFFSDLSFRTGCPYHPGKSRRPACPHSAGRQPPLALGRNYLDRSASLAVIPRSSRWSVAMTWAVSPAGRPNLRRRATACPTSWWAASVAPTLAASLAGSPARAATKRLGRPSFHFFQKIFLGQELNPGPSVSPNFAQFWLNLRQTVPV